MKELLKHLRAFEKESFRELEKAYFFFRFKYPKLFILLLSIVAAYFVFTNPFVVEQVERFQKFDYLGVFLAGILFGFGFTAAFAVGFFVTFHPQNIFLASIIGGLGTFVSSMLIFKLVRVSFLEEFDRLREEHPIKKISKVIRERIGPRVSSYILFIFVGIIIASPLPDEIGITMLAGLTHIKLKILGLISFVLSTVGIYIIFYLSNLALA